MKTLLLLALAITAISSSSSIEDRQNNNYGDAHRNVLSGAYHRRVYRGADEAPNLKALLSQIQMVARVVNGVSLRAEISSGRIPPDQLIAELLSFGTATPLQIISIDNSKIQQAIDAMKKIPESLNGKPDVAEIEKTLAALESVLVDTVDTVALKNTTGVKELKEMVDELKKKKLMDPIAKTFIPKKFWVNAIDAFEDDALLQAPEVAKPYFGQIKNVLVSINTVKAKLTKLPPESLKPSKTFPSAISSLHPTLAVAKESSKYQSKTPNFSRTSQQWTAYSNFISDFHKTMDKLKPSLESIQAVKSVVDGQNRRRNLRNQTLEYTSGFPHGASDMAMVFVDLTDAWMKGILKTDKLQLALEELRNVEVLAKKVEDVLRGQKGGAIDPLDKAVADFYPGADGSEITSGIAEIQKCVLNTNESAAVGTVVAEIQKLLDDIEKQFKTLGEGIQAYKDAASDEEFVKLSGTVKGICDESVNAADTELQGLVGKMKKENLTKLRATVDSIYSLVAQIDLAVTTIQINSEKISNRSADLDAFYTNAGALSTFLECVKSNKNLKSVIDNMSKIANLRKFDVKALDTIGEGLEVVKTVSKTGDDLKKLNHSITEIKNAPMKYKSIQRIQDANNHAKIIGSAVQAVSNMKNALEKRSEVETILKNMDLTVVQKYNVNTTASPELEGLLQLNGSIVKMFTALDLFKTSISIRQVSNLADQSEIFEKARAVAGITGDIQKMRAGVQKLKESDSVTTPQEKQSLETLVAQLDTIDSMGLEFVKYHGSFDGVQKSLGVFDAFFVDFASDLAGLTEEEDSKEGKDGNEDRFPILIIVLVVIGLLLLIASIGNFIWNRKGNDSFHLFYHRLYPHPKWENPPADCIKGYVKVMTDVVKTTYETEKVKTPTLGKKDVFVKAFTAEYGKYAKIGDDVIANKNIDLKYCTTPESPIIASTAPVLKGHDTFFDNPKGEIHANVVDLTDRKKLCLAQSPSRDANKCCTVESYWWMVKQMKAETVIHLQAPGQMRCYPTDPYRPYLQSQSKQSNCLEVRCKDAPDKPDENQINAYKMSVQFKGQPHHVVTVHELEIGASGYPKAKQMAALLRIVLRQKRPVVIDCADGARYSGLLAFAAITTGIVLETKDPASLDKLFDTVMRKLRHQRKGCIIDAKDFAFGAMIVLEYFNLVKEIGATLDDSKMLREGWDIWEATPTPVSVFVELKDTNKIEDKTTDKKNDVPVPGTTTKDTVDGKKEPPVVPTASTADGQKPPDGQKPFEEVDPDPLGEKDGGTAPAAADKPPSVEEKVMLFDFTKSLENLHRPPDGDNDVLTMKDLAGGPSGASSGGAPDDRNPLLEMTPLVPKKPKKKSKSKGTKSRNKKKKPTTEYEEDAPPEEKPLGATVME